MDYWNLGPDNICPANSFTSTKLADPVKIRQTYKDEKLNELQPLSLYTLFKFRAISMPEHAALGTFYIL